MSDEPNLYYVCEVDQNGKVIGRASDSKVRFKAARALSTKMTERRYEPVEVHHYEWLMKKRRGQESTK